MPKETSKRGFGRGSLLIAVLVRGSGTTGTSEIQGQKPQLEADVNAARLDFQGYKLSTGYCDADVFCSSRSGGLLI